jgi:hypothetical protein
VGGPFTKFEGQYLTRLERCCLPGSAAFKNDNKVQVPESALLFIAGRGREDVVNFNLLSLKSSFRKLHHHLTTPFGNVLLYKLGRVEYYVRTLEF